jgi:hypothetical protein
MASFKLDIPNINTAKLNNADYAKQVANNLYMLQEQLRYTMYNLSIENFDDDTVQWFKSFSDGTGSSTSILVNYEGIEISIQDAIADMTNNISLTAEGLTSKVSEGELISLINQSATKISLSAIDIDLSGYVTFNSLKEDGTTEINGSNIYTGILRSYNWYERSELDGSVLLDNEGIPLLSDIGTEINLNTGESVFKGQYDYAWLDEESALHDAYIALQNGRFKVSDLTDSQSLYVSHEGISTTASGNNATGIIDFRSHAFGNSSDGSEYNGLNLRTLGSPVSLQSMMNQVILSPNVKQAVLDGADVSIFDKFTLGMRRRWGYDANSDIDYTNKVSNGDGLLYWGARTWDVVNSAWQYRVGLQFSSDDNDKYVKVIDGDGNLANVIAKNVQPIDAIAVTKNVSDQITSIAISLDDGTSETLSVTWDANGNIASIGDTTITW